jgi:hypothetical protein
MSNVFMMRNPKMTPSAIRIQAIRQALADIRALGVRASYDWDTREFCVRFDDDPASDYYCADASATVATARYESMLRAARAANFVVVHRSAARVFGPAESPLKEDRIIKDFPDMGHGPGGRA